MQVSVVTNSYIGKGVHIGDGWVVTAQHCTKGSNLLVQGYPAYIEKVNAAVDLALLQCSAIREYAKARIKKTKYSPVPAIINGKWSYAYKTGRKGTFGDSGSGWYEGEFLTGIIIAKDKKNYLYFSSLADILEEEENVY